jgi:hypothetical protein
MAPLAGILVAAEAELDAACQGCSRSWVLARREGRLIKLQTALDAEAKRACLQGEAVLSLQRHAVVAAAAARKQGMAATHCSEASCRAHGARLADPRIRAGSCCPSATKK